MANSPGSLKIIMLGDDRVGKSAFLQKYARREFLAEYEPSHQPELYTIAIEFNSALVIFDIWDIPPGIPSDDLIRGSDGAILMFDLQRPSTYESIHRYYTNMLLVFNCKDRVPIPVVICGNKVDCIERKVKPPHITYHREKGLQYYDFSVRSLYNFEKPLLFLARRVLGEPELEYVKVPNVGDQMERERRGEQHP